MHVIHLSEVDSTQLYAKRWLDEHLDAQWAMVEADSQTHGHGQWGREWLSFSGNLHATYIVPSLANAMMGLRMVEIVHHVLPQYPFQMKWPNDIFLNNKKCGGVICEAYGSHTLIGLGLNISCAPKGRSCLGEYVPLGQGVSDFAQALGLLLMTWDMASIRPWQLPPLLYQHMWVDYTSPKGDVMDVYVEGVALDGALRVTGKDGGTMLLHSGRLGAEGART